MSTSLSASSSGTSPGRRALHRLLAFGLTAAGIAPGAARADTVGLTPLLPLKNVKAERIADLFSLMSSELEFMQGVDEVVEIDPPPPALRTSCLTQSACLTAIAKEARADRLLTGTVEQAGDLLTLDLLLFDRASGKTLRRQTFAVSADPANLVDEMTPVLVETVTGQSPRKTDEAPMAGLDFEGEDFDAPEDEITVPVAAPVQAPAPAPPPEAPRTGSARAVDRTIVAPPPPPSDPEPEPEFDPSAFSFDSDASDISFGGSPAAEPAPAPAPAPPPPPPRRAEPTYDDDPVADFDEDEALDAPRATSTARSTTSSSTKRTNDDPHRWRRVHIPVRASYTNYSIFHFAGVGGELQVRTVSGLFITAGVGAMFVSRCVETVSELGQIDNPACGAAGLTVQTSTLVPINFGLLYRFKEGRFQPYLGVDGNLAVIEPADPTTGRPAGLTAGARLRGGFDFFFARNFGLNVDVALGFWSGQSWPRIDPRVQAIGFQPSVGAGLVVAF